jgi:hypothetical protein
MGSLQDVTELILLWQCVAISNKQNRKINLSRMGLCYYVLLAFSSSDNLDLGVDDEPMETMIWMTDPAMGMALQSQLDTVGFVLKIGLE